jgi:hypothetical protein
MRSRRGLYALFAAVALAAFAAPVAPASAAEPSAVFLQWKEGDELKAGNKVRAFIVVLGDKSSTPTGTVKYAIDDNEGQSFPLSAAGQTATGRKLAASPNFDLELSRAPHRIVTTYDGDDNFEAADDDIIDVPTATLTASSASSREGEYVTYTFKMNIPPTAPTSERPRGQVRFTDDTTATPDPEPHAISDNQTDTWRVTQPPGTRITYASYEVGDDPYLPVEATPINHEVSPAPTTAPPPGGSNDPTTTGKPSSTNTTKPKPKGTPTTAALAPINVTPGATTTSVFGATSTTFRPTFPTSPRGAQGLTATGSSSQKDEGPPLVVVGSTLLALSVLGAVAAWRRYRKSAIDWF